MRKLLAGMVVLGMTLFGLAAPAQADDTVNGVKIARGAKIDIVYFSADDCKYCDQWQQQSKESALKWTAARKVAFHEVRKDKIRNPYVAKHFPAQANFAWDDVKASGKPNFVIPRWTVYADGKPVVSAAAVTNWNKVQRFTQDVVDAREGK